MSPSFLPQLRLRLTTSARHRLSAMCDVLTARSDLLLSDGFQSPDALGPRRDRGSATAEYAIATLAAVGFAGLLVVIMRGDEVRRLLTAIIEKALTIV